MAFLRHILAIMALPFVVVVVVPFLLLRGDAGNGFGVIEGTGAVVFSLGFSLFAWCVNLFAHVGQGTLAPWDPTQRLVAVGPYRYVRNPMITGVLGMLIGEALFFGSVAVGAWAAIFFAINHVYFVFSEEPGLEKRLGASYAEYKRAVPRWLPRIKRLTS